MADLLLLVPLENSFLNPVKECYDEPSKPIVQFDPVDVVPLGMILINKVLTTQTCGASSLPTR